MMIRVLFLALVVASISACSFPGCGKDLKLCTETEETSGQIDITCSTGSAWLPPGLPVGLPVDSHRILQYKDWVAPAGSPYPNSCGCSLSLSQF